MREFGNPDRLPPASISRSATAAVLPAKGAFVRPAPFRWFTAIALAAAFQCAAEAAPVETRPVQFARGSSSATMTGTLEGAKVVDFKVRAAVGHTLSVTLTSARGVGHFDLLLPGSTDQAFFVGSKEGDAWTGFLLARGEYTIRVYQSRVAAQRNETADFSLAVGVAPRPRVPRALIRALTSDAGSAAVVRAGEASGPERAQAFVVHDPGIPGG
jgi:hypothetical protein